MMDARHFASVNAFQSTARDSDPRPHTGHQNNIAVPQRHAATHFRLNGRPAWPTEPLRPGAKVPLEVRNEAQKYQGSVIFHWNPIPDKLRMPLNDAVAWFEGSGKQFIAFDKNTGKVKGYLAPTAIDKYIRGREVEGKARTEPKRAESKLFEKDNNRTLVAASQAALEVSGQEKPPIPRYQAKKTSSRGYNPKAPPFDFFTTNRIGPLDEDPDIVWILEKGLYRAYCLSTLEHEPKATPKLVKETTAKHITTKAKEWLKLLKRRVTGDLKTQWDDQLPAARLTARPIQKRQPRNPASALVAPKTNVAAPQTTSVTVYHGSGARQSIGPAANPIQRFDQEREQQQKATSSASLAARIIPARPAQVDDMTLDRDGYPIDSTQTKKRKSEGRQIDTTEYKKPRISEQKQQIPHQRPGNHIIPRNITATALTEEDVAIQATFPPSKNSDFHQRGEHRHSYYKSGQSTRPPSQDYFAEQSNLIARSFSQTRSSNNTPSLPTQMQQAAPRSASLADQPTARATSSSNQPVWRTPTDQAYNGQVPHIPAVDDQDQESFLALLGDDAYSNPTDWA